MLPYGTRLFVPGYGWGIVEDLGGAIQVRRWAPLFSLLLLLLLLLLCSDCSRPQRLTEI